MSFKKDNVNNTFSTGKVGSNDASAPLADTQTAEQNSAKDRNRNSIRDSQDNSVRIDNYVGGDSARSSSSHQFHKS